MNSRCGEEFQNSSSISYRPVDPDDAAFLLEIYASTRAEELALVPWTAEQRQAFVSMQFTAQQEHYQKKYPTARHEIILVDYRPVGHLYVARLEQEIRIVDLTLMPAERNAGVGSFSLRRLLDEAVRTAKVVTIYVENYNPSRRLFERMGFTSVEQQEIYLLMAWTPNAVNE